MSEKLKSCPFCGEKAVLRTTSLYFVICNNCLNHTNNYSRRNEAIAAWNRREPINKLIEEIDMEQKDYIPNNEEDDYNAGYSHALDWVLELLKGGQPDAE